MSDKNEDVNEVLSMTAETVGADILKIIVQEIKLLPKPWVSLAEGKQNDVLDRLRERVDASVKMAVHLIAANGRVTVAGKLEQITIKDQVKAVITFGPHAINLNQLYEYAGQHVLVVIDDAQQHTGGMEDVRGESDQRGLNLGHEYAPDSAGNGMSDDNSTIEDGTQAIEHQPLQEELDKAHEDGYEAAADDKPQSDCPVMKGALCIAWVKGWKRYQEINNTEWWQEHGEEVGESFDAVEAWPFPTKTKKLGSHINAHGVYAVEADEVLRWQNKKDYVEVELLELENGTWLWTANHYIGNQGASGPFTMRDAAKSRAEALIKAEAILTKSNISAKLKGKPQADFEAFLDGLLDSDQDQKAA